MAAQKSDGNLVVDEGKPTSSIIYSEHVRITKHKLAKVIVQRHTQKYALTQRLDEKNNFSFPIITLIRNL